MYSLRRWTHPVVAAVLLAALPALATTVPPSTAQEMIAALARANASVVGVRVMVDEEARSAETLGQLRRGSGVVIAPDGLILTIGYLMLEAEQIEIVTQENKTLPARAVAYDLATGFGLLRPLLPLRAGNGISAAVLGSSLPLQPGEALMAVTGPQASDDGDVSMTRLVSKRPFSGTWEYHIDMALFTSPPLLGNSANHSGAPLFNQKGELVGIGSLLVADASGQNRAMPGNMFVPVDLLRPILAEMQRSGTSAQSHRPWLGLNSSDQGGRIQIVRVSKDSPAELAGLEAGDVVLAVDGTKVATLADFYKKLWDRAAPDGEVTLTVLQGADVKTIVLKAQDRLQTLKKPSGI
ncbi:S1C family serine protease [Polaromonas sp. YR568]|uniref:S1C family serine protease n=1 Tax=Polaromonas sp. YR568 TaxID=1855301 RepID=UPI0031382E71